jgi:Fe-S cluster assembly iron-binding protein IscA
MDIKVASMEELKNEIRQREKELKEINKPKFIEDYDCSKLIETCKEYIDQINNRDYVTEDNDIRLFVFEDAMNCFYGKNIWEWIKNNK